jgi:hypothetical protein
MSHDSSCGELMTGQAPGEVTTSSGRVLDEHPDRMNLDQIAL